MRVVAGAARGIILKVPKQARPLLAMARHALFNSLSVLVPGSRVLDLYAGSGALGIEALSRGAASCLFVEHDRACVSAIAENLQRCRFSDRSRIIAQPVESALSCLDGRFNLIFVDPPFLQSEDGGERVNSALGAATAALLVEEGRIIFRLEKRYPPPATWGSLALRQSRRYGRSLICFYGASAM